MRVLINPSDSSVCADPRIYAPYNALQKHTDIEFIFSKSLAPVWDEKGNVVVDVAMFQRPTDKLALQFIKDPEWKSIIKIIETDDDLENVPFTSPVYKFMYDENKREKIYSDCLKFADYVHVSTPELAKGSKYHVFFNAIDLSTYIGRDVIQKEFREKHNVPKENIILLWQGSTTHYDSLLLIKDAIKELLKDKKITVVLISNMEWLLSLGLEPHPNLIISGWVKFEEAYKLPAIADISLVPLPDNKFNRAKSELKIISSAAWGVPCVASAVSPYLRFNHLSNGGCVLVKKERTKHWLNAIYSLIDNPDLRQSIADKSYKAVEDIYSLEVVNKKRLEWWEKIKKLTLVKAM